MGLSDHRAEQLKNMPLIESRVFKSKDGKYIVHKTVVTDIKPAAYYNAVLDEAPKEDAESVPEPVEA